MIIDDDAGLIDSISTFLVRNGYNIYGLINPVEGLERLKNEKYDILILDYFMSPIKGDDFVSKLREFDRELYVILLTGHNDLAPPFATTKAFDIQAYCEKSHRLDQLQLLIESGIKSVSQRRRITNYKDGLNSILTSLPAIYQFKPLGDILDAVLTQIIDMSRSSNVFTLIDGFGEDGKVIYKGVGKFDVALDKYNEEFATLYSAAIARAKTSGATMWTDNGVFFPIISMSELYEGVIYIEGAMEDDNKHLLEIFIVHVAALIQNAYLHEKLTLAYTNLKSSFVETIEALRLAVDAKDVYTRGHSDRVSMYAQLVGKKFRLSRDDLEDLRISGLFHDIGKIGISDDILLKNTNLTRDEYAEIKEHPTKGALILSAVSAFENVRHIVCCHHECVDGQGYPNGLRGDEIPLGAKIICVVDAFDAMTFDRQYRRRLSQNIAIEELKGGCGKQFDKDIVECFISIIEESSDEINSIYNCE